MCEREGGGGGERGRSYIEERTSRGFRKGTVWIPRLHQIVLEKEPCSAQRHKEKEIQASVVLPLRACSLPSSVSSARSRIMAGPELRNTARQKAVGQP